MAMLAFPGTTCFEIRPGRHLYTLDVYRGIAGWLNRSSFTTAFEPGKTYWFEILEAGNRTVVIPLVEEEAVERVSGYNYKPVNCR